MVKITQSITRKIYNINRECKTILDIKKNLIIILKNIRYDNLNILVKKFNQELQEVNDNEMVDNNAEYIFLIIPIKCDHH